MDDNYEGMPPPRRTRRRRSSTSSAVSSLASVGSPKKKKKVVIVSSPASRTPKRNTKPASTTSSLVAATKTDDDAGDRPPYSEYMAVAHAFEDQVYKYCRKETVDAATQQHLHQWCRETTQQLVQVDAAARPPQQKQTPLLAKQLKNELRKIGGLQREIRAMEKDAEEKKKTNQSPTGPDEIECQRKLAATRFLNGIDALRQRTPTPTGLRKQD